MMHEGSYHQGSVNLHNSVGKYELLTLRRKKSVQLPVCDQKVPSTHCNPTFLLTEETFNAQNRGIQEIWL
jgi:hypothetical protein